MVTKWEKNKRTVLTLPNKSKEIIIYGACYSTMVNVSGGANWLIPKSSSFFKSDKRACGFNAGHPRFNKNINAFNGCILRGTWKGLAALFASFEPCPRSKPNGYPRRCWGWQNAQICEQCYVTFAKDTPLENRYTIRGVQSNKGICDLYSSRMRATYTATPVSRTTSKASSTTQHSASKSLYK